MEHSIPQAVLDCATEIIQKEFQETAIWKTSPGKYNSDIAVLELAQITGSLYSVYEKSYRLSVEAPYSEKSRLYAAWMIKDNSGTAAPTEGYLEHLTEVYCS